MAISWSLVLTNDSGDHALDRLMRPADAILLPQHRRSRPCRYNMQILGLCNRVIVISFGQKICEGPPGRGQREHGRNLGILWYRTLALLEAHNVTVYYGTSMAVEDVSLQIDEGDVVSIFGANGAGKSTFLRSLVGLTPLKAGEIFFDGEKISGKPTNEIVKRGLILVPEGRRLFPYLSVHTNLRLGASLVNNKNEIEESLKEGLPAVSEAAGAEESESGDLERR